jgi:hypothetical protein
MSDGISAGGGGDDYGDAQELLLQHATATVDR